MRGHERGKGAEDAGDEEEDPGTARGALTTTTYVTDRSLLLPVNEVRGRYLTTDPAPTSTLLVVAGLARPEFLVEISAVAVLPE